MPASTITNRLPPSDVFKYCTVLKSTPALPTMNRPGSSRMRNPSGLSAGTTAAAYCSTVSDGVGSRRLLPPPGFLAAFQRRLVNDAQSSADAEKFDAVVLLQFRRHGRDLCHRLRRTASGVGDLRADVHLQTAQRGCAPWLRRRPIDFQRAVQPDAELVLALAGGDVLVPARLHVRVDAQCNRRAAVLVSLATALISSNSASLSTLKERMPWRSAYSISSRVLPTPANVQHSGLPPAFRTRNNFARRDDVEPAAFVDEQVEHGEVAVRLDGIADEVIQPVERRVEPTVVIEDRLRTVNVQRRAVLGGERREIDLLATQLAVLIVKGMHSGSRLPRLPATA